MDSDVPLSVHPNLYPTIDDKMFAVISIYGFVIYILLIKNHKPEPFLYTIFKYIFQRACLNHLTAVNI